MEVHWIFLKVDIHQKTVIMLNFYVMNSIASNRKDKLIELQWNTQRHIIVGNFYLLLLVEYRKLEQHNK